MPPVIRLLIKIDPEGGTSGNTLIHRDVLRPTVMDMHMGEGPANVVEKCSKAGARLITETLNACLDLGQAWMNDLELLAGNLVWHKLEEDEQLRLVPLRAELLTSHEQSDKLMLLSPSGKAFERDPAGMYMPAVQLGPVRNAVLNVYESTNEHRRAEAAAVGAAIKLGFDFTKQSGENVGEVWLLTVKNENGQTVGKAAGKTANYAEYEEFIREIGSRPNVTAQLICLDDLLETDLGGYDARSTKLVEWIPSAIECILDRFHVVKRVNEGFNNHSEPFYRLMVVEQGEVVASRDDTLEKRIDGRLREGSLDVECTWRGKEKVVWGGGQKMDQSVMESHKRSGLYHAMLSSTHALVPVVPNPRKHVEHFYPLWQAKVSEAIRRCSLAQELLICLSPTSDAVVLLQAGTHVHSWPGAAPQVHSTTYYSLHTTYYSLLTTHYLLLTTYYSLLTIHYLLLTTYYLLFTTYYSLLTTHYLLLTTHYSLLTTHYSLHT